MARFQRCSNKLKKKNKVQQKQFRSPTNLSASPWSEEDRRDLPEQLSLPGQAVHWG